MEGRNRTIRITLVMDADDADDDDFIQNVIYLLTYLLAYLLTPCSRALLEKLTGFQLVKKFPAFYGTRRFITTFTSARQLSLS